MNQPSLASPTPTPEPALEAFEPRTFGRYVLYGPIARGGMATIHIARLVGADGFSRIVAAKRLHPQFTEDPEFVAMFRDEAQIASKIHHPNVVSVLDVVLSGEEAILVQEYVHGVPLHRLFRAASTGDAPVPIGIVVALMAGVLAGLHAAHETTDERGDPLHIVHRDVSPQNVMVTMDGVPRLLDFGIAKATFSSSVTRAGLRKGKIAYMSPEQLQGEDVSRASDIYACGVLLWELLTLRRLHGQRGDGEILAAVLKGALPTVTESLEETRAALPFGRWGELVRIEPIVCRALASRPGDRFATTAEMLDALLRAYPAATPMDVAEWVKACGGEYLEKQQQLLAYNEESWRSVSMLAAAISTANGPESGITRVRASAAVAAEPPASWRSSLRRRLPWLVAIASLLLSSMLVGVLAGRRNAPVRSAAAAPEAPALAVVPPAPTGVETPAAEPPARPSASTPLAHAPPRPHLAVASSPTPPAASSASGPKADCDPPFYFEGKKKLFKPGCI